MKKRSKISPIELAQTLVKAVNDPKKLCLEKGIKVFHENTFLMFKQQRPEFSLEKEVFQLKDNTAILKRVINNVIIPLGKRLPETYDVSIDWLENKTKVLDNQEYWGKRIKGLRAGSPTLKK